MAEQDSVLTALASLQAGDWDSAREAAAAGTSRLATELARYLATASTDAAVYVDAAAFRAFVDSPSNAELYRRTVEILGAQWSQIPIAGTVVDLGCGDGRVTIPLLGAAAQVPQHVVMVDSSDDQLTSARARMLALSPELRTRVSIVCSDASEYVAAASRQARATSSIDGGAARRWALVQSTFALHALPPAARRDLFVNLRAMSDRVAVVEFDVPFREGADSQRLEYLADRYEAGVSEHEPGSSVVDGFLLPVLIGQLHPGSPRATWEQPINDWIDEITAAGFSNVHAEAVSPFWWAHAWCVTGS
jgi:SAM-dependent methyltransferase